MFDYDNSEVEKDTVCLYEEILKNYVNLNLMFDFNNPLEVYHLYTKLLYKGYFSNKHNFLYEESENNTFDIEPLGLDVINGSGNCRHISALLKDILNLMNINNEILTIYFYDDDEAKHYHIWGNHVINLASFNEKCYFLDPTNLLIWKKDSKNLISIKHNEINEGYISNWLDNLIYNNNDINVLKNIKKMLSMSQNSSKEDNKIIEQVNKIYKRNLDIFSNFRKSNEEYYQEISNRLNEVNKKRKIKRVDL